LSHLGSIGSVSLCNVDLGIGTRGIYALNQETGKGIGTVSCANKALGEKWAWPIKEGAFNGPEELPNIL
jgi:hypothetical protein